MKSSLGQILEQIETILPKAGGAYFLCVPRVVAQQRGMLTASTDCTLVFVTREDDNDEYYDMLCDEQDLCAIGTVSFVQDIVTFARERKADCTQEDLVKSLNHYLLNDGYYLFDDED